MNTSPTRRGRASSVRTERHSSSKPKNRRGSFSRTQSRGSSSNTRFVHKNRGQSKRKTATFDPSQFINTHPVEAVQEEAYSPVHGFETLDLHPILLSTILKNGMHTPTPIQDQAIHEVLKGRDVLGIAETGTGKTAAFLIPLIHMALKNPSRQTLILAPTRELAIQIESELRLLSSGLKIFFTTCVGGMPIGPQIKALRRDHNFIIGTPGRVIDLIERKRIFPGRINTVVLDEADRMLDMGFVNDMRKILSEVPTGGEKLFFSATMPKEALAIVHAFLRDPVTISVKKKDVIDSIEQNVVVCNADTKFDSLVQILSNPECTRVIVFGTMKHAVEALSRKLSHYNIQAESIHGNKNHNQRQRSLARFKSGNARVLVATDVAARGIHVDDVSHVINYDLPRTFEDYVHRIGRTGRSSKKGKALTFVPR